MRIRLFALPALLLLPACESMTDWADRNGPVIGQRCEHWQCITESGQEQSEMNHVMSMHQTGAPQVPQGAAQSSGAPVPQPPAPPPVQQAEPVPSPDDNLGQWQAPPQQ